MNFSEARNNQLQQPVATSFSCSSPLICAVAGIVSVIFVCALVGNTLVILAVWQNRNLRTNTNILLVNVSLANLLYATVVMPCTVVSYLRSSFMFGAAFCVIYNYAQGVSVGLSAFTLTAISLERYFAVCRPLSSRYWQTTNHCYKIIAFTWILALVVMIPLAVSSVLLEHPNKVWKKCTEDWATRGLASLELAYTIFLDVLVFGIPLLIMITAYVRIGIEMARTVASTQDSAMSSPTIKPVQWSKTGRRSKDMMVGNVHCILNGHGYANPQRNSKRKGSGESKALVSILSQDSSTTCSRTLQKKSLQVRLDNKRKVIRMVVVLVLEFFIAWSPVYALQTWMSIDQKSAQRSVSATMNLVLRISAFASTFAHPLTYCFMNSHFRRGLMQIFKCKSERRQSAAQALKLQKSYADESCVAN